jgi:hypothetical protein
MLLRRAGPHDVFRVEALGGLAEDEEGLVGEQ